MPDLDISAGHRARRVGGNNLASDDVVASTLTLSGESIEVDTGSQALSASVALSILTCTTAGTLTLATAPAGAVKIITVRGAGTANAVLGGTSPDILGVSTSVTFNAAGETAMFVSNGSNWCLVGSTGATVS